MTIEDILDGLNAISREACVSLSNGWPNSLDLERVVRVCSEAYNALRPPGLKADGHDVQLTQEPNPRAAAAVAGHPDPVPLIEKLTTNPDEPLPFGGWTFVDREDGVLVARSPNGTDVPIMWPAPEGESQSFANAVHVHHPQRCTAWTKHGWLGWHVGEPPEPPADWIRCILANGHEGRHALEARRQTSAENVESADPDLQAGGWTFAEMFRAVASELKCEPTIEAAIERARALRAGEAKAKDPILMLLWCPECGERHVDEGEFATKLHHTHACQHCGHVWRPAIGPTSGVRFLPGFRNGVR